MSVLARFEAKVDRTPGHGPHGDCHVWTASTDTDGYGHIRIDGMLRKAHRVAFFLANGRWPNGLGRHTCGNPPCVNADHIIEGTALDNARDRDSRGRHVVHSRGGKRKLSPHSVQAIRDLRGVASQRTIAACFGVSAGYVSTLQTHPHVRQEG